MKRATVRNHPKISLVVLMAAALVVVLLALVGGEEPAKAAFPGQNGKIAFTSDRDEVNNDNNQEIYTTNPASSFEAQTNITNHAGLDSSPSYNHNGTKIAFTSKRDGNYEVYVMDANGSNQTRLTTNAAADNFASFSLDDKIAFTSDRDGNSEIYVMDAKDEVNNETGALTPDGNGDNPKRLTANIGVDFQPAFSPGGTRIAFTSMRDDNSNIYVMNAVDSDNDGNGDNLKRLTKNIASDDSPSFAPDGKKILFVSRRKDNNSEIYRMKAKPEGRKNRPRNLTNDPAADSDPVFSPDGTKIAFSTTRNNVGAEIYRMNADGTNLVRLTDNTVTDFAPNWGVFVP